MADDIQETLLALTADIVAAHVSNNSVGMADLATLIGNVHAALAGLGTPAEAPVEEQKPAVSVRASIKPDYHVCLEDARKPKMLRRQLTPHYVMTPDDYRAKWTQPPAYPPGAPIHPTTRMGKA